MTFKIDTNIPIPAAGGRGPRTDYPFSNMTVGQSIFVPGMTVKKMSGQISYWKKQENMNFAIRAQAEEVLDAETGELTMTDGVRVWVKDPNDRSNRGRKAGASKAAAVATETAQELAQEPVEVETPTGEILNAEPAATAKSAKKGKTTAPAEADDY